MTDDRDARRDDSAQVLAESDLESLNDPDATRPIPTASSPTLRQVGEISPLDRRRRIDTSSEWFWPLVNLLGVAAVVLVNWLANAIPFNDQSTGDVINKDPVPFQPAGWAFSIWGVIYALLIAFAVYGLLPAGRRNPWIRRISPLFLVANIANILWLICWHWEYFPASMVVILVLLVALAGIYTILHWRRPDDYKATRGERYAVWPAFGVYLGWISVASCANFSVLLDRQEWSGGPFSHAWWAVILLGVLTVASAFFAFLRRDGWYPLVIGFAAIAIGVKQWDPERLVSITGYIVGAAALVLAVVGVLMAFDRRAMLGMYSTKRGQDRPSEPA